MRVWICFSFMVFCLGGCATQSLHLASVPFHDPTPPQGKFLSGRSGIGYTSTTEYMLLRNLYGNPPKAGGDIRSCRKGIITHESCEVNLPLRWDARLNLFDKLEAYSNGTTFGLQYPILSSSHSHNLSMRLGFNRFGLNSNSTYGILFGNSHVHSDIELHEISFSYGFPIDLSQMPYLFL